MTQLKYNSFWDWFILFIVFLLGLTLGKVIKDFPLLQLDPSIDIASIFNTIITVSTLGVALYIASNIDREKKKEDQKFNFYINKLDGIKEDIGEFLKAINDKEIPYHIVLSHCKKISVSYNDLKEVRINLSDPIDESVDDEVLYLIKHIKSLCTEISVYKYRTKTIAYTDVPELVITNGNLTFSNPRRDKIKNMTGKIVNNIFYGIIG